MQGLLLNTAGKAAPPVFPTWHDRRFRVEPRISAPSSCVWGGGILPLSAFFRAVFFRFPTVVFASKWPL